MPMTALPPAPSRSNPATFADQGDAMMAALTGFVSEANALEANVVAKEAAATAAAAAAVPAAETAVAAALTAVNAPGTSATSSTSLTVGTGSKSMTVQTGKNIVAGMSVKVASSANGAIWMAGDVISYNSSTGMLVVMVGVTQGAGTFSSWVVSLSAPMAQTSKLSYSARTANVQLTAAEIGTLIDVKSGTFTQTFDAAATLGAGWWCYIRNSGSGDITLDPAGAELIDGLASYVMYPGEVRLVECNGTQFYSVVLQPFSRVFTASGTFVTPPGYSQFSGLLWGGGSSGAKAGGGTNGYGGGGGACVPFTLPASALGSSKVVTIAAEAIGPSTSGNGTQGNNSSIGSLLTAYGGGVAGYDSGSSTNYSGSGGGVFSAGSSTPSSSGGGAPAVASGGNPGFGGANGVGSSTAGLDSVYGGASGSGEGGGVNRPGGKSVYGGGGGGGAGTYSSPTASSPGGISVFGGAGGAGGNYGSSGGFDGIAPGGGGGGSPSNGAKAGNGARGELRIWGCV